MGSTAILSVLLATAVLLPLAWMFYMYRSVPVHLLRARYRFCPPMADYEIEIGLDERDFERIPPYLVIMVVFHEDDLFFSHHGFNWREILNRFRAFIGGSKLKGGSSITQQLAKNVLDAGAIGGRSPRVLLRKIREALFALRLERELTKREILSLYLQSCRLGPRNLHGFETAAKRYFGKELLALSVAEIAFLVSLLPAPTRTIRGIRVGRHEVFPYRNLFGRQRDVVRFIVDGWGWGTLAHPECLEMSQVIERLGRHRSFTAGLGHNFEMALELRSLSMVAAVRRVVFDVVQSLDIEAAPTS